jgi:hypothetical protein
MFQNKTYLDTADTISRANWMVYLITAGRLCSIHSKSYYARTKHVETRCAYDLAGEGEPVLSNSEDSGIHVSFPQCNGNINALPRKQMLSAACGDAGMQESGIMEKKIARGVR